MAKKKESKIPEGTKVTKEFTFILTEKEKSAIADKGAALYANIENTKINFKELKSEWSAKIKTLEAQHAETQHAITAGQEVRAVDSTMVKDYDNKEINYYFEGVLLESRTMTPDECQQEFGEPESGKRAKKQKTKDSTQGLSGMTKKHDDEDDIQNVIKLETNRKTKHSSVDGAKSEEKL